MIKAILAFFGYVPKFNAIEKLENKIQEKKETLSNLQKHIIEECIRLDRIWEAGGNDYHLQEVLNIDRIVAKEMEIEINKMQDKLKDLCYMEEYKKRACK
jgi:hypothetical protein